MLKCNTPISFQILVYTLNKNFDVIYIHFFPVHIDLTIVIFFCFPALIRLTYLRVRSNIATALCKKRINVVVVVVVVN